MKQVSESPTSKRTHKSFLSTLLLALLLAYWSVNALSAQQLATPTTDKTIPDEYNGDVRDLPRAERAKASPTMVGSIPPGTKELLPIRQNPSVVEPVVTRAPMPSPGNNFSGLSFSQTVVGGTAGAGHPSDDNGDVGRNHYIQAVNSSYAIYNKSGALLAAFTEDSLHSGTGTMCDGHSSGDPIVLYDALADRWILTQFAFERDSSNRPTAPFFQCFAVSKSSDPVAGGWWLYAVRMDSGTGGQPPIGNFNDYGKFGIWHDCLYMAANEFEYPIANYTGTMFASLSKSDMYAGLPLTAAYGTLPASGPASMIPSHLAANSGGALPPAGTPNYFVSQSRSTFAFEVRKFTAGPNCGAGGSLSAPMYVSQTPYSIPVGAIIPQPDTTRKLDSIGDRLMQRVQYRKVGATESLWVVHNVGVAPVTSQWAQINVTGGAVSTTPIQEQIYAPNTNLARWMGSIAADSQGNAALGYSTSSASAFPGIAYSGRLVTDPPNTMPQSEVQLVAGLGSQTHINRWGDYTAMVVDPVDDCTFWYTNQYYATLQDSADRNWNTRIGSFKFPTCVAKSPTLGLSNSHADNFAQGQIGATYTITASNTGTAFLPGPFTVTNSIPTGLIATGIAGAGWACTQPAGPCTRSDLLLNGASFPPLTLTVNVLSSAPASLIKSAQLTSSLGTISANDPTSIGLPDLTIIKVHSGIFSQGSTGKTYTVTVSNSGAGDKAAASVSVTDTPSAGLVITAISGAGWSCTVLPTCTRSDALAAGSSYPPIMVTVNVAANATSPQSNTVAVVTTATESNTTNNTAVDMTVLIRPDLTITKTHTGGFSQGSSGNTYTVTVKNSGAGDKAASAVVSVTDTAPLGMTITAMSGSGWTCTTLPTCTRVDALAPGDSYSSIIVTVSVAIAAANPLVNVVTVFSAALEDSIGNNTAFDSTVILTVPDLTIRMSHTGNFSQGQLGAIYKLNVTNSGSAATSGAVATVQDALPAGLTVTAFFGSGWTCNTLTVSCSSIAIVPAGSSFPEITLVVNVASDASPNLVNFAIVSGGGQMNTTNDTASDPTTIAPFAVPSDTMQVRYASNLTTGDAVINMTNTGANGSSLNGPGLGGAVGNICVNVYAFSPDEQLVSCCSCLLTPNAIASVSVNNDLLSNTNTGVRPNSVVIKLLSAAANPGFTGTSCTNSAALAGTASFPLATGMLAYGTNTYKNGAGELQVVETPFRLATLSPAELASITNRCINIIGNGSTFGICRSCRIGALNSAQ